MSDEIGRAKIIVEADTEGVSASISDAKVEVESLGDAGESAGEKVGASFTSAGEAIENKTAGVRKFSGALSSVAGVATGLIGVFGLLTGAVAGFYAILNKLNSTENRGGIDSTNASLEKLYDTMSGSAEARSTIPVFEELEEKINAFEKAISKAQQTASLVNLSEIDGQPTFTTIDAARKELQKLLKDRESFRRQTTKSLTDIILGDGDEAVARFEQYKAGLESVQQQADTIRRGLIIDPLERSKADQDAALESAEKMLDSVSARHSDQGKQLLDAIRERGEAEREEIKKTILDRINAEEKAIAERERKEKEAAERSAKAAADALERAMAPLIASLSSSFGNGFTTQLGAITGKIDEAVDELRKVKRGR